MNTSSPDTSANSAQSPAETTAASGAQSAAIANSSAPAVGSQVSSTGDQRTINNVMRHTYKVLSDDEKKAMQFVKDKGLELHDFLNGLGASRELSVAKTKVEEAVMWAVKHITG